MARNSRIRALTLERVREALIANNGLVFQTANLLGVDHKTLKEYILTYPELREAIRAGKGVVLDRAEKKLYKLAERGDLGAIKFLLATLGKGRGFTERSEVRHGSDPKSPIIVQQTHTLDTLGLPIEVRKAIVEAIRARKVQSPGEVTTKLIESTLVKETLPNETVSSEDNSIIIENTSDKSTPL